MMETGKQNYAVILSAGQGSRMGGNIAKQYQLLGGKPVLYYSVRTFEESRINGIVLVVADGMQDYVKHEIVERYGFSKVAAVTAGGKERYHSVYQGLKYIPDESIVLIHDGARPFVSVELIHRLIDKAERTSACIPAVPVKDTIKLAKDSIVTGTPQRNMLYAVQTPQAFRTPLLKKAYEIFRQQEGLEVTDDAMLVEQTLGEKVYLEEGDYKNIKLTTPEDMLIAEAFLSAVKR